MDTPTDSWFLQHVSVHKAIVKLSDLFLQLPILGFYYSYNGQHLHVRIQLTVIPLNINN
jgi:hypothetical protein